MDDLAAKTSRGAAWRVIETAGSEGLSFLLFVVMARLLLPEHFGIVALAGAIVLSLQCLLQFGIPEALIQRDRIDDTTIRAAMGVSFVLGLALVALTWLLALPLSWMLGRPEFIPIFLALSSVLVLQGLSFPLHGLLRRELNLKAIAIRTLTATAVGGSTAAILANQGFGPWSLVAQQLVTATIGLIMLVRVSAIKPWSMVFDWRAFQPLLAVARPVMLGQFATQAARRLDAVVLGLFLGNHDLGIYFIVTRVIQAGQMVTQFTIGEIALAVLSRLQGDAERLREGARRALRITGFVCVFCFGGLALLATAIVPAVFGEGMSDAGEPLRILAFFATAGALISTSVHVLVSANAAGVSSRLAVTASVVQLAAVFVAAQFGMLALVYAIGMAQLLMVLPSFLLLESRVGLKRYSLLGDQLGVMAVFCIAILAGLWVGFDTMLFRAALSALLFALVMIVGGIMLFRHDLPLLLMSREK